MKISDFRMLSGWIEKYKPALSKFHMNYPRKNLIYWKRVYTFQSNQMMMMTMNCFGGMVDRRKAFSFISSPDHCRISSPSRISDTPRTGYEPARNLSSGLVKWSCAVVVTTTPRRYENPKSALPLKRFIVHFLGNLNSEETKSQIKAHLSYLANYYF